MRTILSDPLMVECFARLEENLMHRWRISQENDQASREGLFRDIRALDQLKEKMQAVVSDGVVAERPKPPQPV